MKLDFVTVDVFTTTPYLGNPLAIVTVPAALKDTLRQGQKQLVAREFNLSETVFAHQQTREELDKGEVRIEIFTKTAEIPFAGHPTIGTSTYLKQISPLDNFEALLTKAGRIAVRKTENGVSLDVSHSIHIHSSDFLQTPHPVVSIVKGMTFILVKLSHLEDLAAKNGPVYTDVYNNSVLDEGWQQGGAYTYYYVDLNELAGESGRSKSVRSLRTRLLLDFEDPATGSAASALCSYLSMTEKSEGVIAYEITQGVEMGRKSDIKVEVELRNGEVERVTLSGTAVKIMEGSLEVPQV